MQYLGSNVNIVPFKSPLSHLQVQYTCFVHSVLNIILFHYVQTSSFLSNIGIEISLSIR